VRRGSARRRARRLRSLVGLALLTVLAPWSGAVARGPGAAAGVEALGNPLAAVYPDGPTAYARNVWDLAAYDGRLFIGSGNSSNDPPAPNAGPAQVWSFDPAAGSFARERTLDEEQVDVFRLIDGALHVPGHDPRGTPAYVYRLQGDAWTALGPIPGAAHVFDLVGYQGRLVAALGLQTGQGGVAFADDGHTWTVVPLGFFRIYSVFVAGERLYAAGQLVAGQLELFEYGDGEFRRRDDLAFDAVFPGVDAAAVGWSRIARATPCAGTTFYVGAAVYNDLQWVPFGLYAAATMDDVRPVPVPDGATPRDVLAAGGRCLVLTSRPAPDGRTVIGVVAYDGPDSGETVVQFEASTFARSVELLDGRLYFGLGTDGTYPDPTHGLSPDAGSILRVPAPADAANG
jgi:hypothetical protein